MPVRNRSSALPGLTGTVRVERRPRVLLPRLRPGDVAVIDQLDLDRATAQALVDARVSAVLNVSPFLSGRYPALGPTVLAEAGVLLVDRLEGAERISDGTRVRLHDEVVYVGGEPVAMGRGVDLSVLESEMGAARSGLGAQMQSFTHNSVELLRREEGLLIHGEGLPRLGTRLGGRPVVVVVGEHDQRARLKQLKPFLKERRPVLVGVDGGADALRRAGHRPDVVVVGGGRGDAELPSAAALRAAHDVVVRVDRGERLPVDQLERLGVRYHRVETSLATEDVALLVADAGEASVIVGVGTHATLDDLLDRQRTGLASAYLTRLRSGQRLVDAAAVPTLYSGRVRPRHVLLTLLVCVVALAAAIATTPVGQEWVTSLVDGARSVLAEQGWLP
ncbi:putative cytokinetic ring protein SteA [Nocardioides aestuarii]|uniref:Cytokinetic ring protein SteA n=1 Tax=Nocardioides aestuarii TaxID=252231 RepID=A0ABW4TPX0_9ACTN